MLELMMDQPIFIGFKADSTLRQHLETLTAPAKQYISVEDSTFLRLCRVGDDVYIGKLVHETLTTDRVEDIRRNVLSLVRKIGHEMRLPDHLRILACSEIDAGAAPKSG